MRKSVLLGLGGALMAGGYALKRYLDGKIADSNGLYSGYKDAAVCEGGKAFVKGFNSLCERAEGWFDEPQFVADIDESLDKLRMRVRRHPRLNGEPLCPQLCKMERFAFAKVSREQALQNVAIFDEAVSERCEELENEAQKLEKFIDGIYRLEEHCYNAHLALCDLGKQFERLENFAPNTPTLPPHIVGAIFVPQKPTSIYERISHYKCEPSNFDLAGFDEGAKAQIDTLCSFINEQRELVSTKCAFLKALVDEQALENGEKADFAKFSKPQQSLILGLAKIAECLQRLINASFVEFENGLAQRYKNAQKLIDELYKDTPRSLEMQDFDESLAENSAENTENSANLAENSVNLEAENGKNQPKIQDSNKKLKGAKAKNDEPSED